MTGLSFSVIDVRADAYAAVPTLQFRLRIVEAAERPVHALLLRCQLRLEPQLRRHASAEQEALNDLFGVPSRWAETLKPLLWTNTSLIVPAFTGSIEIDVPAPCTYDFEVAAAKYLNALEGGEVPLLLLFSGTVFFKSETGFQVEQISWNQDAPFRMPVRIWRELMEAHFPGCAWIRLRRESLSALQRYRAQNSHLNWDDAIAALMGAVEEPVR